MVTTGVTVDLAEGIIDDACLVSNLSGKCSRLFLSNLEIII